MAAAAAGSPQYRSVSAMSRPALATLLLLLAPPASAPASATPSPSPASALSPSAAAAAAGQDDFQYQLTEAQYYEMPQLFHLDDYAACAARGQLYCVGTFQLSPARPGHHPLFERMQRYSANWVDHFNHTLLHRGLCVSQRCPAAGAAGELPERRFAACVNSSTAARHGLAARLLRLQYCRRGAPPPPPLHATERALAALFAAVLVLAALSTTLDLTLPDHKKKGLAWALAWSLPGSWRDLTAPARGSEDLRIFDGVRVVCMLCVIMEHVCWLATLGYVADPRFVELKRREPDVMLLTNSTLVVQLFFLMSSFLLAHKLLRRAPAPGPGPAPPGPGALATFCETMLTRIIRISPSYWVVVWWAGGWWGRLADGPLWTPLVGAESAICRRKWWTHLLYINNIVYPDDKCLIQTWYLAADMQLYALSLALLLLLRRGGAGAAAALLAALLGGTLAALLALAWLWHLLPTFVMHRPECVQAAYSGDASFNVLYQSPLGNAPGALAGLLLALLHRRLRERPLSPQHFQWFRWAALAAFPLGALWAGAAPLLLGGGRPARGAAAALAALERPVFAALMAVALLGAMHGVRSPWRALLAWRGWAVWARLSFAALLLHMPLNKALLAARLQPAQLDRGTAVLQWAGVAGVAYMAALPLALLLELPAQRLLLALRPPAPAAGPAAPAPAAAHTDKTQR